MLWRNVLADGHRTLTEHRRRIASWLQLGAFVLLLTLEARAAGLADGRSLVTVDLRENGWVIVCFEGSKGGPACGGSNDNCLAFDGQTGQGKSMQSLVTAAFLAGRKADLFGTDTCNARMPDVEELARFVMH